MSFSAKLPFDLSSDLPETVPEELYSQTLYKEKQKLDTKKWHSFLPSDLPEAQTFSSSGILLIDKPADISSTDVIRFLKKICRFKKIGHAGTLDPFAEGLLIVLINKATKLSETLMAEKKIYSGRFVLGLVSDTQDISGNIRQQSIQEFPSLQKMQTQALKFRGKIQQVTPLYSARKVEGKPLYKYARAQKKIQSPIKEVEIFAFEISALPEKENKNEFFYRIVCGKGTYVRTLIHDLGQTLGCGAVTKTLYREKSGGFACRQALPLTALQNYEAIATNLLPLTELPQVENTAF